MRLSPSAALPVLLLAAVPTQVAAHGPHGDVPIPRFLGGGRRFVSELLASARAEMAADAPLSARAPPGVPAAVAEMAGRREAQSGRHHHLPKREEMELDDAALRDAAALRRRQVGGKDGKCGPGAGSCAQGYCCSPEGWCGLTPDYCSAPDCLINYGSGCDANQKPEGVDTSNVPRPHVGSVLYGGLGIYDCVKKGDIAITFDDGPYNFTGDLLDKFAAYGAKATFFITGNNLGKGMINDYSKPWAGFIRRMVAEGHQVASHTWSHQNASQLTAAQYRNQIIWNEIAFNDILGFFPAYMRPPYSICESACQKALSDLGYHVIYFDLDTEGYLNDDKKLIQNSKDIWDEAMDKATPARSQYLMIEHDIHYQTVYNLTDYVLTSLFARGWRSVTVGECLGDPKENWYRQGSGSSSGGGAGGGPTTSAPSKPTASHSPTGFPSTTIRRTTSTRRTGRPTSTATSGNPDSSLVPDNPIGPPGKGNGGSSPAKPTETGSLKKTVDGDCGNGVTCLGSRFGDCCSVSGFCGRSADYCGATCQPGFGACSDSAQ
ncbi:hypothetical protein SPBR_02612 [Sporothrix brasiliensis 5110]|uniref:Chitin deacetylase n=1 Tax=Sporothrix brasiliensis 5110 TaxID=1398154 RepID=A0A0C2J7J4_9PEZI|nr:uncharacterized protein SPBR_02612 [Sporothrix brasiliensis 5110]KIH92997.1 hypothetical protein SPBR_02612 [Sporothrix brasiliensis 5110]